MSINSVRFEAIHKGLSAVAQKVYQAVPMIDAWPYQAINAELQRVGVAKDLTIIRGCLNSLVESGLIVEPERNKFVRVKVRGKSPAAESEPVIETNKEPQVAIAQAPVEKEEPAVQSPIQKLEWLGARVATLSSQLKALADEIDNTAVEMQMALDAKDSQMAKFRQLKALLTEIN